VRDDAEVPDQLGRRERRPVLDRVSAGGVGHGVADPSMTMAGSDAALRLWSHDPGVGEDGVISAWQLP